MSLKCRKCRHILVTQPDALLTAHGEPFGTSADCANVQLASVFYVQEERVPAWIGAVVDKEGWLRGRLHCPKCNGRVGGFDFVSGQKCACGQCVLPAVHLVSSKLDQH